MFCFGEITNPIFWKLCQINNVKYRSSPLVCWAKKICGLLAQNQIKRKSMASNAGHLRFHIWKSGFHIWKCGWEFISPPCIHLWIHTRNTHQHIMMRWCVSIRLRKFATRSACILWHFGQTQCIRNAIFAQMLGIQYEAKNRKLRIISIMSNWNRMASDPHKKTRVTHRAPGGAGARHLLR